MGGLKRWYPFFFGVLPILNTLTRNPGGTRPSDMAVVIGAALLGCAVLYLLVIAAFRGRWSNPAIPLIVLILILLFYGKNAVGGLSGELGGGAPLVLVLVLGAMVAGTVWLVGRPRYLDQVNRFFGLTGTIMVAWLSIRVIGDEVRAESTLRHSVLAHQLAQPIGSRAGSAGSTGPLRDIYLIVLDEYANSGVLREQFHYDNRVFEDSLRHLGFTIPILVRSNYVHTVLSLPSLLNFSHLTRLASEVGVRSTDASLPNYLLENNRTAAFLKARGYRFLFFPSLWWPSTDHNRNADWEFEAWPGFHPMRAVTRSDLRRSYVRTTALGLVLKDDDWDGDHIERTLQALTGVPERPEPTFAFAHIVSPHTPYVFRSDCARSGRDEGGPRLKSRQAYIAQLQCINRLVLATVTSIIRRSPLPPLILLQGDHGTNMLRYSSAKSARSVSPAQARERFGAFGAYYLPGGGARSFTDTVTIVNVFQKVLSDYFGADVSPSPDEMFVSLERTPFDFARVDPRSLGAPLTAPTSSQLGSTRRKVAN